MEERVLRDIAQEHLVPFFSGAKLDEKLIESTPRDRTVAYLDQFSIAFKLEKDDSYRLVLRRQQPFRSEKPEDGTHKETIVSEVLVVSAFINALRPIASIVETDLRRDILLTFARRVVAKALQVLGNGFDTLLEFDLSGRFISHVALLGDNGGVKYCPYRQMPIGDWTAEDEYSRRVAFTLNRNGEILAFRDGQLQFARRAGRWYFITHQPIIDQMATPQNIDIRRAVYETCIDVSFGRRGGCIGIVSGNMRRKLVGVVSETDLFNSASTIKAQMLKKIVGTKSFHALDRRIRQELLSIDGATVISNEGEVLAVGAIVRIPSGSSGGGRMAAAKALSELGLGIKISQDGRIMGFRLKRLNPVFQVM